MYHLTSSENLESRKLIDWVKQILCNLYVFKCKYLCAFSDAKFAVWGNAVAFFSFLVLVRVMSYYSSEICMLSVMKVWASSNVNCKQRPEADNK